MSVAEGASGRSVPGLGNLRKFLGGQEDLSCFQNMGRLYLGGGGRGEVMGRGEQRRAAGQAGVVGSGA